MRYCDLFRGQRYFATFSKLGVQYGPCLLYLFCADISQKCWFSTARPNIWYGARAKAGFRLIVTSNDTGRFLKWGDREETLLHAMSRSRTFKKINSRSMVTNFPA